MLASAAACGGCPPTAQARPGLGAVSHRSATPAARQDARRLAAAGSRCGAALLAANAAALLLPGWRAQRQRQRRRGRRRRVAAERAPDPVGAWGSPATEWARSLGIWVSPKLDLAVPTALGRGCVARERIEAGEPIAKVPLQSILRAGGREDGDPAPPAEGLADFWGRWPQREMRLAAWLLVQSAGGSGAWAPYFASLPRAEDDAVFFWSEAELQALPSELGELRDVSSRRAADCARAASDLREAGFAFGDEEVARAVHAAYSRPFLGVLPGSRSREVFFLPIVDLVNHSSAVPMNYSAARGGRTNEWVLGAGRDFAAGEEVVHSYAKGNDDLLLQFGFVEDENLDDVHVLAGGRRVFRFGKASEGEGELPRGALADSRKGIEEFRADGLPSERTRMMIGAWRRARLRLLDEALAGAGPA